MGRTSLISALILAACAPDAGPEQLAGAPLAGVDGRADSADHACHVVLRSAGRIPTGLGGYRMQGSSWVFEALVDVSDAAIAEGASAALSYSANAREWREAAGEAVEGAPAGFQRVRFEVWEGLPGEGMSGSSLSRAKIELAPFLRLPEGGRLFDHNRLEDAFANATLVAAGGFSVVSDAATCPGGAAPSDPAVTLAFREGGAVEASGGVVAGRALRIEYALERLAVCREEGWDVVANVRLQPSGRVLSGSVREGPFTVQVPEGTARVELWFENRAGGCRAWDSNGGADHVFPILSPPGWVGGGVAKVTRATGHACAGGSPLGGGFRYDTWARERSVMGNVCLEVWKAGVTDWDDPALWQRLDARAYYRFDPAQPFEWQHVSLVDRVGNNARYALSAAALDPFRRYHCPSGVPVTRVASEGPSYDRAELELYFEVNGVRYAQGDGAPFRVTFEDYPDNAWRAGNCR